MINVSEEFYAKMQSNTDFKCNALITFKSGDILELKEKDFALRNNSIFDGADSSGIPIGATVCRTIQLELANFDDQLSDYDFFDAKIRLFLTFQLEKSVEKIEFGTFTVDSPESYGSTVIVTAFDNMYRLNRPYNTEIAMPSTAQLIFVDICSKANVQYVTADIRNKDYEIKELPQNVTLRQMLGYIAMLAGGNARFDRMGRLEIIEYNFQMIDKIDSITGGTFAYNKNTKEYDGGTFVFTDGDDLDGGTFDEASSFIIIQSWKNLKLDTDDVVITGISTINKDTEEKFLVGTTDYELQIENPLIEGKEQKFVEMLSEWMVGARFRKFEGDTVANPLLEFMDIAVLIDRKGNAYTTFLTDINFEFGGFTTLKNTAPNTLRNSSVVNTEITKTFVEARKRIEKEKSERESAVDILNKEIAESSGLYTTQEQQEDNSIIYYMHDKPTIESSKTVWKMTENAIAVSIDGGKTYPYGLDANGMAILNRIYAIGIDADYVKAGTLTGIKINNGNGTFSVDEKGAVIADSLTSKNANITGGSIRITTNESSADIIELKGGYSHKKLRTLIGAGNIDIKFRNEDDDYEDSISINHFGEIEFVKNRQKNDSDSYTTRLYANGFYLRKEIKNNNTYYKYSAEYKTDKIELSFGNNITVIEAGSVETNVISCKKFYTTGITATDSGEISIGKSDSKIAFYGEDPIDRISIQPHLYNSNTKAETVGDDLNNIIACLNKLGLIKITN